jgi:hypothetical protein
MPVMAGLRPPRRGSTIPGLPVLLSRSSRSRPWLCLALAALFLLFTTALTAFHSLQTIAPTHGMVGDAWESALERLGLDVDADGTMQGAASPRLSPSCTVYCCSAILYLSFERGC